LLGFYGLGTIGQSATVFLGPIAAQAIGGFVALSVYLPLLLRDQFKLTLRSGDRLGIEFFTR
jgi:nitrate/nitrite transporter NarK